MDWYTWEQVMLGNGNAACVREEHVSAYEMDDIGMERCIATADIGMWAREITLEHNSEQPQGGLT